MTFADVFIGHRHFIETGRNQRHTALAEEPVHFLQLKFSLAALRLIAARAVRFQIQRFCVSIQHHAQ
jgi:hypothetical protein